MTPQIAQNVTMVTLEFCSGRIERSAAEMGMPSITGSIKKLHRG